MTKALMLLLLIMTPMHAVNLRKRPEPPATDPDTITEVVEILDIFPNPNGRCNILRLVVDTQGNGRQCIEFDEYESAYLPGMLDAQERFDGMKSRATGSQSSRRSFISTGQQPSTSSVASDAPGVKREASSSSDGATSQASGSSDVQPNVTDDAMSFAALAASSSVSSSSCTASSSAPSLQLSKAEGKRKIPPPEEAKKIGADKEHLITRPQMCTQHDEMLARELARQEQCDAARQDIDLQLALALQQQEEEAAPVAPVAHAEAEPEPADGLPRDDGSNEVEVEAEMEVMEVEAVPTEVGTDDEEVIEVEAVVETDEEIIDVDDDDVEDAEPESAVGGVTQATEAERIQAEAERNVAAFAQQAFEPHANPMLAGVFAPPIHMMAPPPMRLSAAATRFAAAFATAAAGTGAAVAAVAAAAAAASPASSQRSSPTTVLSVGVAAAVAAATALPAASPLPAEPPAPSAPVPVAEPPPVQPARPKYDLLNNILGSMSRMHAPSMAAATAPMPARAPAPTPTPYRIPRASPPPVLKPSTSAPRTALVPAPPGMPTVQVHGPDPRLRSVPAPVPVPMPLPASTPVPTPSQVPLPSPAAAPASAAGQQRKWTTVRYVEAPDDKKRPAPRCNPQPAPSPKRARGGESSPSTSNQRAQPWYAPAARAGAPMGGRADSERRHGNFQPIRPNTQTRAPYPPHSHTAAPPPMGGRPLARHVEPDNSPPRALIGVAERLRSEIHAALVRHARMSREWRERLERYQERLSELIDAHAMRYNDARLGMWWYERDATYIGRYLRVMREALEAFLDGRATPTTPM